MAAHILVVEDEGIVARDIQRSLLRQGYTVVAVVSTGEEAIRQAEATLPDLVLMDIRLAGVMNGIEAAEQIRQRFHIPVVYLTAYADPSTLQQAKVTEPFGYILKPFEDRELQTAIEMALYKHQAEKRLRESQQWLDTTLRSIGDGVIATDTTGSVAFMNPTAESLTGWKQEEAAGKAVTQILHLIDGKTRTPIASPVSRVLKDGKGVGLPAHTLLVARDQSERPIDDGATPIKDHSGKVSGAVLVFQDITDRRRGEERRTTQFAITRILAEAVSIEEAIPRLLRVLCQGLGWEIGELWCLIPPSDVFRRSTQWRLPSSRDAGAMEEIAYPSVALGADLLRRVLVSGRPEWTPDAQESPTSAPSAPIVGARRYSALAFPIQRGQGISEILVFFSPEMPPPDDDLRGLMTDLGAQIGQFIERKQAEEALRRSEERFQAAVSGANDGLFDVDLATDRIYYSPRLLELLGFTGYEEEVAADLNGFALYLHPEEQEAARKQFEESIATGGLFRTEHRVRCRNGEYRWFLLRGNVQFDTQGHPARLAGFMTDITERKEAERQLQQALEQQKTLARHLHSVREEERARVARELHDELGQVLTGLKIDVAWLRRHVMSDHGDIAVNLLGEKIEAMNRLVDTTLQTVRKIATELRPAILDTLGLVSALEWQAQDFQRRTGITCQFVSSVEELSLDQERMTVVFRIFQEALTNILRHAQATRVQVSLNVDDEDLLLVIHDNGKGIRAREIRGANSLGLLGIRERALLVGGDVRIVGVSNRGTTVTVRLPIEAGGRRQQAAG